MALSPSLFRLFPSDFSQSDIDFELWLNRIIEQQWLIISQFSVIFFLLLITIFWQFQVTSVTIVGFSVFYFILTFVIEYHFADLAVLFNTECSAAAFSFTWTNLKRHLLSSN